MSALIMTPPWPRPASGPQAPALGGKTESHPEKKKKVHIPCKKTVTCRRMTKPRLETGCPFHPTRWAFYWSFVVVETTCNPESCWTIVMHIARQHVASLIKTGVKALKSNEYLVGSQDPIVASRCSAMQYCQPYSKFDNWSSPGSQIDENEYSLQFIVRNY